MVDTVVSRDNEAFLLVDTVVSRDNEALLFWLVLCCCGFYCYGLTVGFWVGVTSPLVEGTFGAPPEKPGYIRSSGGHRDLLERSRTRSRGMPSYLIVVFASFPLIRHVTLETRYSVGTVVSSLTVYLELLSYRPFTAFLTV